MNKIKMPVSTHAAVYLENNENRTNSFSDAFYSSTRIQYVIGAGAEMERVWIDLLSSCFQYGR